MRGKRLLPVAMAMLCSCGAPAPHEVAVAAATGVTGNTLCLNAIEPGVQDSYQRIESTFGKGAVESPSDSVYTPMRPHVREMAGDGIAGPHFAILAVEPTDVNLDLKTMAEGGDRSRTEIKIAPGKLGPHAAFQAHNGDTYVYTWRFRIAPDMKFSPSFTHIHQIKAYGGMFADPPLITFTALADGNMEVRHIGDMHRDSSVSAVLGTIPLAGVPGQWIAAREEIVYSNTDGRYRIVLRDQKDAVLLNLDKAGLQMWRSGADHMRPKWGIYRKHHPALNQNVADTIYFANFGITRGRVPTSACR